MSRSAVSFSARAPASTDAVLLVLFLALALTVVVLIRRWPKLRDSWGDRGNRLDGIDGWLRFLLVAQIAAPVGMIGLGCAAILLSHEAPPGILFTELFLGAWSWMNAHLLLHKRRQFIGSFLARSAAVVLIPAILYADLETLFVHAYVGDDTVVFYIVLHAIRWPLTVILAVRVFASKRLRAVLS